ncbi:hypothetical protein [Candidatus Electronema sp. PJ]|uniref:hypothetical protein n=1 Tax=Candidatus Electronema sp. PJ TaxID=3401572 RepID=UPI003AA9A689
MKLELMVRKETRATLETLVIQAQLERRETPVKLELTVHRETKATPEILVTQVQPGLKGEPEIRVTLEQLATEAQVLP